MDPRGETDANMLQGVPVIFGEDDLIDVIETLAVERVIVASTGDDIGERTQLLHSLASAACTSTRCRATSRCSASKAELHQLEGLPLITLPTVRLAHSSLLLKRAMDLAIAVPAVILLAPLFAYMRAADPAGDPRARVLPPGARRPRRRAASSCSSSARWPSDAEDDQAELAELNMHARPEGAAMFKIPEDPR